MEHREKMDGMIERLDTIKFMGFMAGVILAGVGVVMFAMGNTYMGILMAAIGVGILIGIGMLMTVMNLVLAVVKETQTATDCLIALRDKYAPESVEEEEE